jgi:hypothetical protein
MLKRQEIRSFWKLPLLERRPSRRLRKPREPNAARKLLSFKNTTNSLRLIKLHMRNLWMNSSNKRLRDSTK